MSTNKNAAIRYQALDKCFRDRRNRYYIDDLIDVCDEALIYYNGTGGVSRRRIFEDIKFMENDAGWSIPLERKKDGKKVYYRYEDSDFSINQQPLTDEEAQQLQTVILTLSRFRGLPSNEWVEEVISNLEWLFNLKGKTQQIVLERGQRVIKDKNVKVSGKPEENKDLLSIIIDSVNLMFKDSFSPSDRVIVEAICIFQTPFLKRLKYSDSDADKKFSEYLTMVHDWRNDQAHKAPTATEQECDFAINVLTTMYLFVVAFGIKRRDIEQGETAYKEDMQDNHDLVAEPGLGE